MESLGDKTAVRGNKMELWCTYPLVNRVSQVLWKKTAEQGDTTTVASYTRQEKFIVESQYKERVQVSQTLGHSLLTIDPVHMEDEGCYTCDYHTYPGGTKSATACLNVYGMYIIYSVTIKHKTFHTGDSFKLDPYFHTCFHYQIISL